VQDEGAGSPVFIKSIVPGGSCDRDGICRAGDIVVAVNNEKVSHLAVVDIREKIVGPMGTAVVMLFQRPNGEFYEEISDIFYFCELSAYSLNSIILGSELWSEADLDTSKTGKDNRMAQMLGVMQSLHHSKIE
jgi:hypothetical protein